MSDFIIQALQSELIRPYLGLFVTILVVATLFDIVFFTLVVRWVRSKRV